jgi:hypothetical protein
VTCYHLSNEPLKRRNSRGLLIYRRTQVNRVLWVKALREKVSKEKLRIKIFEPRRSEVNCSRSIQEDTWKTSMHFGEK